MPYAEFTWTLTNTVPPSQVKGISIIQFISDSISVALFLSGYCLSIVASHVMLTAKVTISNSNLTFLKPYLCSARHQAMLITSSWSYIMHCRILSILLIFHSGSSDNVHQGAFFLIRLLCLPFVKTFS